MNTTFNDFNLEPKVLKAVTELGFEEPTPIQMKAIPIAMSGQGDARTFVSSRIASRAASVNRGASASQGWRRRRHTMRGSRPSAAASASVWRSLPAAPSLIAHAVPAIECATITPRLPDREAYQAVGADPPPRRRIAAARRHGGVRNVSRPGKSVA